METGEPYDFAGNPKPHPALLALLRECEVGLGISSHATAIMAGLGGEKKSYNSPRYARANEVGLAARKAILGGEG